MTAAMLWGMGTATLLIVTAGLKWSRSRHWSLPWRLGMALVLTVLAWSPVMGLPLVQYARGAVGDLSIGTALLLSISLYWLLCGQKPVKEKGRYEMLAIIAVMGGILYPLALGLSPWDSYRWGFEPRLLSVALFALALGAWLKHYWMLFLWLLLAMLAFQADMFESNNLWDYLIDPLSVIYAWFVFAAMTVTKLWRKIAA